jgi:hypothetical protein
VYLGTSLADVNSADLSKAVSKGQSDTTFQPASPLEYGKTYYWRVDEVNAPPSTTVFKGDVWSFTVEPYAYPITGITATASSSDKSTTGPANTISGSGLTNDLHSTSSDAMWMSSATGPTPVWIRYQFNRVYKLYELWVWNHNTEFEPVLGYGCKDVTIETSTDGTNWTLLKDVQFAQAPATGGYAHNTTVDLGGAMARYVRLTAKSNWSAVGLKQFGLAEARFFYVPVEARGPQPAQYAEGVAVDGALDWRPGREATSHQVVFGTDQAAVADGTATGKSVTEHGFTPGTLDFGTKYYWKVDEVGTATYPGSIWSFTTQEFAAVDNFETYTDDEGSRIYESWVDGWTNSTGSVVGYLQAPFAERSIVHGGTQAMPLAYDNTKAPYYSEVQQTFDTPMDWTVSGAATLSLWFRGPAAGATPANDPAGLYVVVEDKAGKTKTVTNLTAASRVRLDGVAVPLSDLGHQPPPSRRLPSAWATRPTRRRVGPACCTSMISSSANPSCRKRSRSRPSLPLRFQPRWRFPMIRWPRAASILAHRPPRRTAQTILRLPESPGSHSRSPAASTSSCFAFLFRATTTPCGFGLPMRPLRRTTTPAAGCGSMTWRREKPGIGTRSTAATTTTRWSGGRWLLGPIPWRSPTGKPALKWM